MRSKSINPMRHLLPFLVGVLLATTTTGHSDLLLVSLANGPVEKFDLATGADLGVFVQPPSPDGPWGMAFDTNGNLYVVNGDSIDIFTPTGVGSVFASNDLSGPYCLALDHAGNLYTANGGNSTVMKFTPQGVGSVFARTNLSDPIGLVFDQAGNLYVANYDADNITKFTPEGVGSSLVTNGLHYPTGLAFDNSGNLFVANYTTIEKFAPDGTISFFATNGFGGPLGLVFDQLGNLYVASALDSTIVRFTPSGVRSVFAHTPAANQLTFMAIVAEPSILRPPQSQTAEVGTTVGFRAHAEGTPLLCYQWYFNGSNALASATNASLRLSNIQPSQAGAYIVVITNAAGAVTSPPAILSVIPPIPRRPVPVITLLGTLEIPLTLGFADSVDSPVWTPLMTIVPTNIPQMFFDLAQPMPAQRFYRAWQSKVTPVGGPRLSAQLVTAVSLTGNIGSHLELDSINQFGPVENWITLATLTLTNTTQLYFDFSAVAQPPRLYRVLQLP